MCWGSSPNPVHLSPHISSASICGMRQFVYKITRIDTILIGYWMTVQVRNMRSSEICRNKLRIGDMNLRRILMTPCEMFCRYHLKSLRIIAMLVSIRGRVDGRGNPI